MADNIKVVVRVRPLVQREINENNRIRWTTNGPTIQSVDGGNSYVFDHVYNNQSTLEIYSEVVSPIVMATMEGFNGTVFAYGQTASGKTFTMFGDPNMPGIVPVAVDDIFNTIENNPDKEYVTKVSYMEIYNEQVSDLLSDSSKNLDIREDMSGSVYVRGLMEEYVTTSTQVLEVIKRGEKKRHFAATNMNERSSRSHTLFRITIGSRQKCDDPAKAEEQPVTVGNLNLVDLAGSEKANQTGATGLRLVEGGNINRSLLTLSQVISQLSENSGFVSYRDSKLTRILQNALGGNSKTSIICNVTPASMDETNSTLKFATRAKRVKNKPVLNEVLSEAAMLNKYKTEVEKLKKQLDIVTNQDMDLENKELKEQLKEMERQRKDQEDKLHELRKFFFSSSKMETVSKVKAKRRQTWYAGKSRMSVAPLNMRRTIDSPKAIREDQEEDVSIKPQVSQRLFNLRRSAQVSFAGDMDETIDKLSLPNETFGTSHSLQYELAAVEEDCASLTNDGSSPGSEGQGKTIEALRLEIEQKDDKIRELFEIIQLQSSDIDSMEQRLLQLAESKTDSEQPSQPAEEKSCEECKNLQEKVMQFWLKDSERVKKEEELLQQMNALTKANKELEKVLEAKEGEIMELKDLREFEKEEVDFKNESMFHHQLENEVEKEMEAQLIEMKRLKNQLMETQCELEDTKKLVDQQNNDNDNDLQDVRDAEIKALRDQIVELQKELEESKVSVPEVNINQEEARSSEVKDQEIQKMEMKILQDELTELRQELEEAKETNQNKELDYQENQLEKEECHQKEITEIKDQLKRIQEELTNAQTELIEAKKDTGKVDVEEAISKAVSEEQRRGQVEMREKLAAAKREALTKVADEQNELLADLKKQESENKQLIQKYTKAKNDADLAEHQMKKAEEEKESIRSEMHTMHSLLMDHEKQAKSLENNPEKLMDRFKKLATNLDLTTQRCQNYEAKMKEFKGIADKADELTFQRNNLQRQLRDCEGDLKKTQDDLGHLRQVTATYQAQMSQCKLQIDLLQDSVEQMKADKAQAEHNLEEMMRSPKPQADESNLKQLEAEIENKWMQKLKMERSAMEQEMTTREHDIISEVEKEKEKLKKQVEEVENGVKKCKVQHEQQLRAFEHKLEQKWLEKLDDEKIILLGEFSAREEELKEEHEQEKEEIKKVVRELEREARNQTDQIDNDEKLKELEESMEKKMQDKLEEVKTIMEKELRAKEEELKAESEKEKEEIRKMMDELEEMNEQKSRARSSSSNQEELEQMFEKKYQERITEERAALEKEILGRKEINEGTTANEDMKTQIIAMEEENEKRILEIECAKQQLEEENFAMKECVEMAQTEISDLKNTLIKLTEEHETTLLMLHSPRRSSDHIHLKLRESEERLREAEETIIRLTAKINELENSLKVISRDRERLQDVCNELEADMEKTGTQTKNPQNEKMEKETEPLKERINELEGLLQTSTAEGDRLRNLCDEFANDLDKNEAEIDRLKEDIRKKVETIEQLQEQNGKPMGDISSVAEVTNLEGRIKELEEHLQLETSERERLRNVCDEFAADLDKNENQIEKLKSELELRQAENEKLSEQLRTQPGDTSPNEGESVLQGKVAEIEEVLKIEISEKEKLQNICDEFEADLKKNETEISKLKAEVEQKTAEVSLLRGQLTNEGAQVEQVTQLEARITSLEACVEVERDERERLKDICDKFAEDLVRYEVEIETLNGQIGLKDAEIQNLSERVEKQSVDTVSKEESLKLQERISELEEQVQMETKESERLRNVLFESEADVDKNEAELRKLEGELAKKDVEINKFKERVEKQGVDTVSKEESLKLQERISELEEQVQMETKESERLRNVLFESEADVDKNEAELRKLEGELAKKDVEINKLKERISELEEHVQMETKECERLRNVLFESEADVDKNEAEITKKDAEILMLKNQSVNMGVSGVSSEEMATLKERISELEEHVQMESKETERLRNALFESEADVDKNEAEIRKLMDEVSEKDAEIQKLQNLTESIGDSKVSSQEIAALKERISELEEHVQMETKECDRLRFALDETEADVDKNEAEIRRLVDEVAMKNTEIQKLQNRSESSGESVSSEEMTSLKAKLNEVEEHLQMEISERERLTNIVDEFDGELNKNESDIRILKTEIEQKNSEVLKLKDQLEKSTGDKVSSQELTKLKAKINELEEFLQLETNERERLRNVCDEFGAELDKNETEIDKLKSEIEHKESEIIRIKALGTHSGGASDFMEKENVELREKIKRGSWMLQEKEKELATSNKRYFALKEDREQLYDILQEKKAELEKLQRIIDDNRMDCAELSEEEQQRGLKQSYSRLKTLYDMLQHGFKEQAEEHENKRKEYRGIIGELRKEVKEWKEKALKAPTSKSEGASAEVDLSGVPESFTAFLKNLEENDDFMGQRDFQKMTGPSASSDKSSLEIANGEMRQKLMKCFHVLREKAIEMKKQKKRFAALSDDREQLYDLLQEKKAEIDKLQTIIDDNRMECTELSEEEQQRGLKQSYVRLKTLYDMLQHGFKEQAEEHENKRKEYRGIIGDLRREVKALKEGKGGATPRSALSEIQNVEEDKDDPGQCKTQ